MQNKRSKLGEDSYLQIRYKYDNEHVTAWSKLEENIRTKFRVQCKNMHQYGPDQTRLQKLKVEINTKRNMQWHGPSQMRL